MSFDMGGMMQQAQKMQKEMKVVQEDLKKRTVLGESGGGLIKVYANGQQDVMKIEIDPSLVDPQEVDMLEDLVVLAVKAAMEKSKELSQSEMARVTGPLGNLSGMF